MNVVPFPEKVMVQTISRCNAACRFCPYPHLSPSLPQGEMDEDLFRRIIDECAAHPGMVQRLMLYLMNEPLLDGSIVSRINYAKQQNPGASVHILTNGSLLTERRGDALIDSGLDWIGISIHGFSEQAYAAAMGLKREVTYRRVQRFIERALARRGPDWVMVTFNGGGPVTPEEREAELAYFRELGVQRISYFGQSISRAGNVPIIAPPRHEKIQGCRSIWWPEMIHILYSGDLVLCCMDWKREVALGNLRERSIEQIWRSEAYRRVRDEVCGLRELSSAFPCSRCEEAIVEPVSPTTNVDVGLVVLPCAVMDSDASTVPGVQSELRTLGLTESLADLSTPVYQRTDRELTHLWHRAGHGVVHHGDGSEELIRHGAEEVEWCVARCRELPADHLLFALTRANRAMTLEVIRRIKERDPGRFLLAYGQEPPPGGVLDQFGVPYHRYDQRHETAAWVARSVGREIVHSSGPQPGRAGQAAGPAPDREAGQGADRPGPAPQAVEPPWRPPGWEGTGAGMVPPLPGESEPSALDRGIQSIEGMVRAATGLVRSPLLTLQEIRRQTRGSFDALLGIFVPSQAREAPGTDRPLSGVPGSLDLRPLAKTGIVRLEVDRTRPKMAEESKGPQVPGAPATKAPLWYGDDVVTGEEVWPGESDVSGHEARDSARVESGGEPAARSPVSPEHDRPALAGAPARQELQVPAEEQAGMQAPATPPAGYQIPWQNRPDLGRPMDLLLGTCPPWGFNNPPVALAHLAGYARSKGYGVEVLDMNIDLYHRLGPMWELLWHVENKNYWSSETTFNVLLDIIGPHLDHYAELIAEHPAPLVGLSVVDPKERCTIELIRRIKERAPGKRILLGGPACVTPEYRRIFVDQIPDLIDGYAMGEGEQLLCDVIEAVRVGRPLEGVPGVLVFRDGQEPPFKRRKRLTPLDLVPFPLYEDFRFDRYPGDELIVEWSRGCIGSCAFCKGKMIDGKYRMHSAAAILESLKHYCGSLGLHRFTVCDPVINGDVKVMEELCRLIVESGLKIQWRGEAIPHAGLSAELLRSMRAAGCSELQLGLESGSDAVLRLMRKGRLFDVATAARVTRDCHAAGIRTALFIIIGFPGEGEAEFMETYSFVKDNADAIDELKSINSLHIITDTPIHRRAEKWGLSLPERDYHYRWSTRDGSNDLQVRNDRIRRLKALADELGIFVRETNLAEGKHHSLEAAQKQPAPDRAALVEELRRQINAIESV